MGVATESAKVFSCTCCIPIVYLYCTDKRRPPLEEVIPEDDLNYVDPQLRGRQGYRLWYLKCRNCRGRAVCKELDDGTRVEFRITVPHICYSDEINIRAKRVEDIIVEEASDPAAILPLRRIHERHVENLPPEVRAKVRTTLQLKSKVSRRRKKQLPQIPGNLMDLVIPPYYSYIHRNGREAFFQGKLDIVGIGQREEVVLLFATERFMRVLFNKDIAVADGGFKHAPRRFKQVKTQYFLFHYSLIFALCRSSLFMPCIIEDLSRVCML